MPRTRILQVALAGLLAGWPVLAAAPAAVPASPESVRELLELTNCRQMADAMTQQMRALTKSTVEQALRSQGAPKRVVDLASSIADQSFQEVCDDFSWTKLEKIYIQAYAEAYAEDEVQALIGFYKSPTGRMMIRKTPVLMEKTMALVQQEMIPIMQRMQRNVTDKVAALVAQDKAAQP
ncbi:MAG TPA: DUF2059 domain-containing protein [Holophaga sp.]|nr:DUF2059 domain-containing protein [Holophaga sp.]